MRLITIEVKQETMIAHEGKMPRARFMWFAPGLEIYVKGPLSGVAYEQASNLALHVAMGMNIPAISVKRYSANVTLARQSSDTKSKRMGGF